VFVDDHMVRLDVGLNDRRQHFENGVMKTEITAPFQRPYTLDEDGCVPVQLCIPRLYLETCARQAQRSHLAMSFSWAIPLASGRSTRVVWRRCTPCVQSHSNSVHFAWTCRPDQRRLLVLSASSASAAAGGDDVMSLSNEE